MVFERLFRRWGHDAVSTSKAFFNLAVGDLLQDALWCVWTIQKFRSRRIKHPRNPTGLIVAEMSAVIELEFVVKAALTRE